jgi:PPOX class probable F420-dependent enzyme
MEMHASAIEVINSGRLAHLVTINEDGSPQVTIVWVEWRDGEILVGKLAEDYKTRNIRRDPRVALSIEAEGNQYGMQNYLVVEGIASVTEGGAAELLHDLAQRYVGPGTKFPPMDNPPAGFVIRITPTKVRGMGPWGTTF